MADWRDSYSAEDVARIESEVGPAADMPGFDAAGHIAAVWSQPTGSTEGQSASSGGSSGGDSAPSNDASSATNTSRFDSVADAIDYAQRNGQGALSVAADGTITNRFGEVMVYDSDGNLAPRAGSMPGSTSGSGTSQSTSGSGTNGGSSSSASQSTDAISRAVSLLSAEAKADLYAQIGDAMYSPSFNLEAHIQANTKDGVFNAPIYTAPDSKNSSTAASPSSGSKVDWLGWLSANEKVLDTVKTELKSESLLKLPTVDSAEWLALMEETGGAAANPGFNYAAHVAAITSQKVLTGLTEAEVLRLIAETGKTDFRNFDVQAHNEVKLKTVQLAERAIGKLSQSTTSSDIVSQADIDIAKKILIGSDANDVLDESVDSSDKTVLAAGAGDDTLKANAQNNALIGGEGNDSADGGAGIDIAIFEQSLDGLRIQHDTTSNTWTVVSQIEGQDTLINVERINADDGSLALDIDGNAGTVAKVLGAVFGENAISNKEYVGIGLDLADGGMNYAALAELAVSVTGKSSSTDVCTLLWTNVVGSAPTAADIAPFKAMLDSGQMSIGSLAALAADTSFNTANIDLIGLSQTGLEYV